MIKKVRVFLILASLIVLFQSSGYSQEDRSLYFKGVKTACAGNPDLAFMYLRRIMNEFPESKYSAQALFGAGEYYFSIGDYYDAKRSFIRFLNDFPESEAKIFALAYLLKMAEREEKENKAEELRKELIGLQQVSLLFRDYKILSYKSPLCKNYKALNFIDKIEICIDDEVFAKVSY